MSEVKRAKPPAGYLGVVSYVVDEGARLDGVWTTASMGGTEVAERRRAAETDATGGLQGDYDVAIHDQKDGEIFVGGLTICGDDDGVLNMTWDGVEPNGDAARYEGMGLLRNNILSATWGTVPLQQTPERDDSMVTLTSRWKLKNGAPPELCAALDGLAAKVAAAEPDTLVYLVHVRARSPLDHDDRPAEPPVQPISAEEQDEVLFVEVYRTAEAFAHHLTGPTFTDFVKGYLSYFYEDPNKPGSPRAITEFLSRQSGLIRDAAVPEA